MLRIGIFSSCGEQGLFSSCGARTSHCSGFSCRAQSLGARASVAVLGLSCPKPCGVFPDQGLNPSQERACGLPSICAVPWQVLEGSQIPRVWKGDSSTTAVDSGISQFSWPVSTVYLTLSTLPRNSNTSTGACVNVALTFSWFRGEPATGFFVWETQKSHE